jgi:hypothetical protein
MHHNRRALSALALSLLSLHGLSQPAFGLGFRSRTYPAGVAPNSVVKGDFNNDGKLDLVIADSCQTLDCDTYGVVKVLLGNGNGTFTPAKKYRAGQDGESAVFVTAGDFNRDGNLDVAVVNNGINLFGDVSVLLGHRDGSFSPPVPYEVGGSTPVWAAARDFNRDGNPDLAVSVTTTDSVAILLGNGDGTFQPAVNYPTEDAPQGFAVADLNHDGKLDLAVANECGHTPGCRDGTVSILLGRGNGTFRRQVSFFVGIFPLAVAVADFNGDSHRDLVLTLPCGTDGTCVTDGGVGILLGNGDGSFQGVSPYVGTGLDTARLGVGDFNGDHHPDVVALNYQTSDITVFPGSGDGTLQSGVPFPVGANPISVAVADFNRDKATDLAVVNQIPNNVSVLLNKSGK